MLKKTEHLAWVVLIVAFLTCITFTIGTPLGIRQYILHSTHSLDVLLRPRDETVTLQQPGSSIKALVSSDTEVTAKDRMTLSSNASAFLLFYENLHSTTVITPQPFITVQFYGDTEATLESAQTPRFAASRLPHLVVLNLQRGTNTRITIEDDQRASRMRLQTPHGVIEVGEGTYSIVVGANRTEFAVAVGKALIQDSAGGNAFTLVNTQRVELTEAGTGEIQAGEWDILRNRNGDFEEPLEDYWEVKTSAPPGESGGTVRRVPANEREIILFERWGDNPAKTSITQEINQDIRGAQSLRIRARVRVDMQGLAVCGSLGTECPIMILVYITDQNSNAPREWLQGFYAVPGTDTPFCYICDWKAKHIQVPQVNIWYDYESEDLLPLLRAQGFEPSAIRSVEINASGHTYGAAIDDIAILVGE